MHWARKTRSSLLAWPNYLTLDLDPFQMNIENHPRHPRAVVDDDDDRSEGELDSSFSDEEEDEEAIPKQTPKETSQSWTTMLTEQNLSSIMSNALADNTEIIHIDDPIAQEGVNPLSYVFPPGTDVDQYFQRKKQLQKKLEHKSKRKPSRRDLKNLSHLLHKEKNEELLRTILDTIGVRRAFQFAQQAIQLHQADNAQNRTLGGVYFKMLISPTSNDQLSEGEREQIKRRNQELQKVKKKQNKKKAKAT